jgi:hypothetical protein
VQSRQATAGSGEAVRILRITFWSEPCTPPPYSFSLTRPSVWASISALADFRAVIHLLPSGTRVAIFSVWAVADSQQSNPTRMINKAL